MKVLQYIIHRAKGFFAQFRETEARFVPVVCHVCHRTVHVREGMLGQDLAKHFQTVEHVDGEARRRW